MSVEITVTTNCKFVWKCGLWLLGMFYHTWIEQQAATKETANPLM